MLENQEIWWKVFFIVFHEKKDETDAKDKTWFEKSFTENLNVLLRLVNL